MTMPTLRSQKSRNSPFPGRLIFFITWLVLQGASFLTFGALFSALLFDEWARWAATLGVSVVAPLFFAAMMAGRARQERVGKTFRSLWLLLLLLVAGVPWAFHHAGLRTTIATHGLWPTSWKLGSVPAAASPASPASPAIQVIHAPTPSAPVAPPQPAKAAPVPPAAPPPLR